MKLFLKTKRQTNRRARPPQHAFPQKMRAKRDTAVELSKNGTLSGGLV
ncbi:hypothetical protein C8N43_1550 [Litoreibacter ponti]|uniref:Uncharacterized protein n=1 Tax=Litoreibacter ponti TaxID=1510457 RepID=A0A2T6BLF5_9RHOB|nr:hypothetical protein C8N43_1550 [Litoreibacter ponti]